MPDALRDLAGRVHASHAGLPLPPEVGRAVSLGAKRPR
jgi:hypothetical protein